VDLVQNRTWGVCTCAYICVRVHILLFHLHLLDSLEFLSFVLLAMFFGCFLSINVIFPIFECLLISGVASPGLHKGTALDTRLEKELSVKARTHCITHRREHDDQSHLLAVNHSAMWKKQQSQCISHSGLSDISCGERQPIKTSETCVGSLRMRMHLEQKF
jgi:hypothetical protein